ncbi:MAG: H-type small acid-soluble spore protein [Clostridia bacterium]|nr:H-type small acid-soluble spore protein [Clostridia bacterium]
MEIKRVYEILNNKEKVEVEYKSRPVWIQNLENSNEAKIGFIDDFKESTVQIQDLIEK